jgi:hypothetical protein
MEQVSIAAMKALLALDANGALVPHGLGGHGRACLSSAVQQLEELKAATERVCAFDWSDNDADAARSIDELRAVLDSVKM